MRKFPIAFAATILLASQGCVPGTAVAPAGTTPRTAEACQEFFAKLDANGDGVLTDTEYVQGRAVVVVAFPALAAATDAMLVAHLKGLDADHDGKVTSKEFGVACLTSPAPSPAATACTDCAQLVALDRDKDGVVSFEEFFLGKGGERGNKGRLAAAFAVADRDGDGRLTAAELCGPDTAPTPSVKPGDDCRQFLALDGNDDGKVTDEEYFVGRGGTQATKEALVAEFRTHDANGDGVLTADELCGPTPSPSESPKPTDAPTTRPTDKPTDKPTEKPTEGPSPSAKPTDDCAGRLATYDTGLDGSVNDEEYFVGVGGTQANKNQIAAEFRARDTNGDGVLSAEELCGSAWPRTATVKIYNPMTPFGPQFVDIVAGGTVTFENVNSGVAWTIRSVGSPSFPDVPLATSPATATTVPLTAPGNYEYVIDGTNPFVVHGHIIVH